MLHVKIVSVPFHMFAFCFLKHTKYFLSFCNILRRGRALKHWRRSHVVRICMPFEQQTRKLHYHQFSVHQAIPVRIFNLSRQDQYYLDNSYRWVFFSQCICYIISCSTPWLSSDAAFCRWCGNHLLKIDFRNTCMLDSAYNNLEINRLLGVVRRLLD